MELVLVHLNEKRVIMVWSDRHYSEYPRSWLCGHRLSKEGQAHCLLRPHIWGSSINGEKLSEVVFLEGALVIWANFP